MKIITASPVFLASMLFPGKAGWAQNNEPEKLKTALPS